VHTATRLRPLIIAVTALAILACAPPKSASALIPASVSVSSPSSGAVLEGTTTVSGSALKGTYPIARVQVGVDNANFKPATGVSQWSLALDTAAFTDGSHTITVRAVDTSMNVATSSVPVKFANAPGSSPVPAPVSTTTTNATEGSTTTTSASTDAVPFSFGVQYHGMWDSYTDADRTAILDKLAQAKASWVRMDIGWRWLEPAPGRYPDYYVSLMDRLVDAARARGLNVLITVLTTPGWANGNQAGNVPPSDPTVFTPTARFLASHFGDRVAAWEVWNEPNYSGFWTGDATSYVSLLRAAYTGFKAGNPSATVVLGGVNHNDVTWLRAMYQAGGHGLFDVMATHPYLDPTNSAPELDNNKFTTITFVRNVIALMKQYGDGSVPIWFTEFGWSSHANTSTTPTWQRGVTLQQQADYLVRALKLIRANYPYVAKAFWYTDRDTAQSSPSQDANFGLLRHDLTPKPAFTAVQSYLTSNP
jgi:hypothetical protein